MEGYWRAGCFDPGETDRMYRDGIKPEQCVDVIDVGGELMTVGYNMKGFR